MHLNNTLTRLLAIVFLLAGIKVAAISIEKLMTHLGPTSEDILVKYGYDEPEKPKAIPNFTAYMGDLVLTPEEFNSARSSYLMDYLEKITDSRAGPKPMVGVTAYNEQRSEIEQAILAEFNRQFPRKKEDSFRDKVANIGHSAAIGIAKSLRLLAYFGGADNAAANALARVIAAHQAAMSETEKIEAQRATQIIESSADVSPFTGLRARLENIRATWAVEALIIPFILLEVVFFRKIQSWNLPKLPALPRPIWATVHRKMLWAKVSKEDARQHHKYGVKNGLIVLIIYLVLSPLSIWGSLNKQLWEAGVTHGEFFAHSDSSAMVFFQLLISLVMAGVVLWAMFTKQPKFRRISTAVFASYFPVFLLLAVIFPSAVMGQAIAQGFIQWVIFGGLWVLYLQRSQRVRVTFEHAIKTPRPKQMERTVDPT